MRELASVIERAAILGEGKSLDVAAALGAWSPGAPSAAGPQPLPSALPAANDGANLDGVVKSHIEEVLAATKGRIEGPQGAAQRLGINPHTLRARMRKLGIEWSRFRTTGS